MVFSDKKFVGKKIKEFRKKANLTQAELAEKVGLSETHMSKIEIGANSPTLENFLKICEVLNLSLEEFGVNVQNKKSLVREKFIEMIYQLPDNKLEFYSNLILDIERFKTIY